MTFTLSIGRLNYRKWKYVVRNQRGDRYFSILFPTGHFIEASYS